MIGNTKRGAMVLLVSVYLATPLHAANSPFEIDVNELDRKASPAKETPKRKKPKAAPAQKAAEPAPAATSKPAAPAPSPKGSKSYVVQEGDYRLKTLAKHLHLSVQDAEELLPEILRLNKLTSLSQLQLGKTILIPASVVEASQPPAAPQHGAAAQLRQICSVTDKEPGRVVDAFLNALQLQWSRNHIIDSGKGAEKAFSVRVDRFFTYKKTPHIVTVEHVDPYTYTLLRVLESSGYRIAQISPADDFRSIGEKIFKLVGVTANYGAQPVDATHTVPGFAVLQRNGKGKVIITDAPVDAGLQEALPAGCTVQ